MQVTTSVGARSGFQLTFSMGKNSNFEKVLIAGGFFDPMIRVIIIVTLNGTPNVIMDGVITTPASHAEQRSGKSTLTVTGEDVSAAMDLIDFSGIPYPAMPAEARVALCIAKYAMFGIIPMVIPSILIDVPIPVKEIPKHQGTDLAYINSLANEVGYVFTSSLVQCRDEHRLLGTGNKSRRAAARAEPSTWMATRILTR